MVVIASSTNDAHVHSDGQQANNNMNGADDCNDCHFRQTGSEPNCQDGLEIPGEVFKCQNERVGCRDMTQLGAEWTCSEQLLARGGSHDHKVAVELPSSATVTRLDAEPVTCEQQSMSSDNVANSLTASNSEDGVHDTATDSAAVDSEGSSKPIDAAATSGATAFDNATVDCTTNNTTKPVDETASLCEESNHDHLPTNSTDDADDLLCSTPSKTSGRVKHSVSLSEPKTAVPAAGHGVDPKYMTRGAFRSILSNEATQLAEQLKAIGQVCAPLCSPRKLDQRRQKRAQKRIQPQLCAKAKPLLHVLHPPCVVSGAVYSKLANDYQQSYQNNLRELYNEQLEKEVNVERFTRSEGKGANDTASLRHVKRVAPGRVTGKFSNEHNDGEYAGGCDMRACIM